MQIKRQFCCIILFSNIRETCCAAIVCSDNSFLGHPNIHYVIIILHSCNSHGVYAKKNTKTKYTFSRHVICDVLSKLALPGLAFLFRGGFNGITNLTTFNHCLGTEACSKIVSTFYVTA